MIKFFDYSNYKFQTSVCYKFFWTGVNEEVKYL